MNLLSLLVGFRNWTMSDSESSAHVVRLGGKRATMKTTSRVDTKKKQAAQYIRAEYRFDYPKARPNRFDK